ncbi:MAG TPA: PIG-L deacetylase family protein [Thermodesulfovibrionales bacterium]|nr:PIG-L deacetylase family protein [Thermodesulfovibrionales bacterium]
MLSESEIIPYHLSPPAGERVVVLAPHPDDETFGCGGALSLLVDAKKKIKVLFLTSGDKAESRGKGFSDREHITEYSLLREREAERALGVLGVSEYEFLRFPDREIHEHYQDALQSISKTVEEFSPDTIYAPSLVELNPDHRTAAAMSMEIQRRFMAGPAECDGRSLVRIVFYEVATPLRPNTLVDITPVYRRKKRAMKRYRSQLKLADYLGHTAALNTVRALTVKGPRYVEAFWCIETPLSSEEIANWLSYREVLAAGY